MNGAGDDRVVTGDVVELARAAEQSARGRGLLASLEIAANGPRRRRAGGGERVARAAVRLARVRVASRGPS